MNFKRSYLTCSLARYDVVITTYGTALSEIKSILGKEGGGGKLEDLRAAKEEEEKGMTYTQK